MIRSEHRSTYVPHIDGLRAVAVLSVMVYHLSDRWLPGGFSGVDTFFVISGFVVSASLAQFKASASSFFTYFYARRILRIVPALIVCLLVTHIAAMLLIPPAWLSSGNQQTGLWAFFGLSNFILANNDNAYFSPTIEFNPYTHTWSLGVEEQFYLIFPPLFVAWIAGGRWRRLSMLLFAAGLVASIGYAWWLGTTRSDYAFYMLATRFWELAGGVLLYQALTASGHSFAESGRPATRASQALAIASAALIAIGLATAPPRSYPFPGGLLPVLGTLGLLAALHGREPRGLVMRLLRNRLVVFIGQISYSLYLWHWPVYVLFRWTVGLESVVTRVLAVAITFALAIASYLFIERPPRRSTRLRALPRPVLIACGVALLGSSAWLAARINASAPALSLSTVARNVADWQAGRLLDPEQLDCLLDGRTETVGGGALSIWIGAHCKHAHAPMPRVFAIGDSHLTSYWTMLLMHAMDNGAEVYSYANGGCPYLSLQPDREGGTCPGFSKASVDDILSRAHKGDVLFLPSLRLYRLADQYAPTDQALAWKRTIGEGTSARRAIAVRDAIAALQPFARAGMHIVLEAPKPVFRAPPVRCADWFNADNPICAPGLTMQRTELERYRAPALDGLRQIATHVPGASLFDPFPILCPDETCASMHGERPLFLDGDHLSGYGNRLLLPYFEKHLAGLTHADTDAVAPTPSDQ